MIRGFLFAQVFDAVQECDATIDHRNSAADYIIIMRKFLLPAQQVSEYQRHYDCCIAFYNEFWSVNS